MSWRLANSLVKLRNQINAAYPKRDKSSDGTIGDSAHSSRASDHNPWVMDGRMGIVTALDITHDAVHGCDAGKLAETLRASRDKRIKYVISNRRIFSRTVQPWVWRPYAGSNPHSQHVHISVNSSQTHYDDTTAWAIGPPSINQRRLLDITATVFGGANDPQKSAYGGGRVDPDKFGCALPFRFPGTRPQVRVINRQTGQAVICDTVDVGPWETNDPYWKSDDGRPAAETGKDSRGRKTNKAGIDLTPAAAKMIGIPGKGLVDWEFI